MISALAELLAFGAVVLATGLGVAWASAAVVYPVWASAARRSSRLARSALTAAAIPWVLGAAFVLACLLPGDPHTGQALACHCGTSGPGWAHLCPVHPASAFGLLPAASFVLLVLLPGRLRAWWRLLREPRGTGGGATPTVLDLPRRIALLVGWLRPSVVVDRRLWTALTPTQRTVVLAHEAAHLRRRDPTLLMVLRALASLGPRPAGERLARAWLHRAELSADAGAARAVGDPVTVAETLLACARLGQLDGRALALGWTAASIELRVSALLDGSAPADVDGPDVRVRDAVLAVLAAVAAVVATPWVHHHLEHLLNLSL